MRLLTGEEIDCKGCTSFKQMKKRVEKATNGKYPAADIRFLHVSNNNPLYVGLKGKKDDMSAPGLPGVPKLGYCGVTGDCTKFVGKKEFPKDE